MTTVVEVRGVAASYRSREVFSDVAFQVREGQCLGVVGTSGAGKTTLLRIIAGLLSPSAGEVRVAGVPVRAALSRVAVAYFAGDTTLPGGVRASAWASFNVKDLGLSERRRLRTLSRGTRQLLGLRTVLARHPLDLIILDEPWEALDTDGARWLSATLQTKRDRGSALILSSHRMPDLAGVCDAYLFLLPGRNVLLHAHQISAVGPVTTALLTGTYDALRGGAPLRHVDL